MTITEFLLARLEEDHQLAAAATLITSGLDGPLFASPYDELTDHIIHWEPERVLNEVSAKRAVVELHRAVESGEACGSCVRLTYTDGQVELGLQPFPCPTIRALVQSYAEHPGFSQEWRV